MLRCRGYLDVALAECSTESVLVQVYRRDDASCEPTALPERRVCTVVFYTRFKLDKKVAQTIQAYLTVGNDAHHRLSLAAKRGALGHPLVPDTHVQQAVVVLHHPDSTTKGVSEVGADDGAATVALFNTSELTADIPACGMVPAYRVVVPPPPRTNDGRDGTQQQHKQQFSVAACVAASDATWLKQRWMLPLLPTTDPVARYYGWTHGTVVAFVPRYTNTSVAVKYRVVALVKD